MNNEQREELTELVTAHFDGAADRATSDRLQALLHDDPEAQAFLVECTQMHSLLLWEHGGMPSADLPQGAPAHQAVSSRTKQASSRLSASYWKQHRLQFGAVALALTLMLWMGMGWIIFSRFGGGSSNKSDAMTGVAQISDMRFEVWAQETPAYQLHDALESGDTLELIAGYVEITFQHGAVVLLEAPVTFTVNTRGAGTLDRGRLVARIEKQAASSEIVPFAVSTPLAQIIDQGTQFGVESATDGSTQVEVFQGRVEATLLTNARERILLREGESARIAANEIAIEKQDRSLTHFVQELPDESTQVISPIAVISSLADSHAEACIDGSGLNTAGEIGAWTHAMEFVPTQTFWGTFVHKLPATLTFDLGAEYDLSTVWVWNFSHPLEIFRQRCSKTIGVAVSSDGDQFTSVGELVLPAFEKDPTMGERFSIKHRARYVRFEILDSYMPEGARLEAAEVGLGEVRFEGTPAEN